MPQFSVGEPVSVARVGDDGAALAVGGRENDLHVWDLETQKTVFKVCLAMCSRELGVTR